MTARQDLVLVVQTAVGDYRQGLLDVLEASQRPVRVVCGREYFDPTTTTRAQSAVLQVSLNNRFLLRRRLLWQTGAVKAGLSASALILEFNPRILTNWVLAILGRLRRNRVVFWGHLHSRKGSGHWTNVLRRAMRSLGTGFLAYTEDDAESLRRSGYQRPIHVAPNSLYSRDQMRPAVPSADAATFLYVGRLVPDKKPMLLIKAFARLHEQGSLAKLVIVGDGPLRNEAAKLLIGMGLDPEAALPGHIADYEQLRSLYKPVVCSVSPGYVGLSVTQSLGFGVPVIYPRDEPHSPEVVLLDGTNSLEFTSNDEESLANVMLRALTDRDLWLGRRDAICAQTARLYSAEVMAEGLLSSVGVAA
jgi:glycosyltransferase involved in cell wall biosynthesis